MKFKMQPGESIPDTLIVHNFTTTKSEVVIRTVSRSHIPCVNNIIGMPVITISEYPETVTYTNYWRTIEINTLEELLMVQTYLGDIKITHEPCIETDTKYSIYTVEEYED